MNDNDKLTQGEETNKKPKLYELIMEDILKKIDQNDFSFEKPICTEKELVEKYGVSRITAKRAITDLTNKGVLYRKPGVGTFVSRNVLSSISDNPPEDDSKMFAFILPFEITKGGLLDTVQVANSILTSAGCCMGIYITSGNTAKEKKVLNQLIQQNISGLIFYPMSDDVHLELLDSFVIRNKPVIIIDKNINCQYIHGVVSDNFNGARMLTEHLVSLGHKNIAYLSRFGTSELSSIRDRFGGFIVELKKFGISVKQENIITDLAGVNEDILLKGKKIPELNNIVNRLYKSGVTAIEAENDEVAYAIYQACQELEIRIPEDLSLCGFDDSAWAGKFPQGLTTIGQDFAQIGQKAGEILLDNLKGKLSEAQKHTVPVKLFIRGTTAPPRDLTTTNKG